MGLAADGQVVGYSTDASGVARPFLFQKGAISALPLPAGSTAGHANAINASGSIAGFAVNGSSTTPVLWDPQASDLGQPVSGFPFLSVVLLGDDGTLIERAANADDSAERLLVRHGKSDQDISLANFALTEASAVNAAGKLVGFGTTDSAALVQKSIGFVYQNGTTTTLQPLSGDDQTIAHDVTASGKVYGFSYNSKTQSVVLFDEHGGGTVLRTEPNGAGFIIANDELVIEGYGVIGPAPLVYVKGAWEEAESLVAGLGDFKLQEMISINARGDVAGTGKLANGQQRAFLLQRLPVTGP
jgi:probable HAF family extracellular repeat protein